MELQDGPLTQKEHSSWAIAIKNPSRPGLGPFTIKASSQLASSHEAPLLAALSEALIPCMPTDAGSVPFKVAGDATILDVKEKLAAEYHDNPQPSQQTVGLLHYEFHCPHLRQGGLGTFYSLFLFLPVSFSRYCAAAFWYK